MNVPEGWQSVSFEEGPTKPDLGQACLTPASWLARQIPEATPLLGSLLTTTSRAMFAADTGLGKTMFAVGIAFALNLGQGFLHWEAQRPARVLYVDGEMPRDLMQERIALACGWFGTEAPTDGLYFLNREDFEDMPPLDSAEGQQWLDGILQSLGQIDFIVFDNLMSLTAQSLKEEDGWLTLDPWVKSLTKRGIGQLWVHHVGHDKSRGYGSKLKEWGFDTVMHGERIAGNTAEVAFKLSFTKARRRKPSNRDDFADTNVELREGVWSSAEAASGAGKSPQLPPGARIALEQLRAAIDKNGEPLPGGSDMPRHKVGVRTDLWRTRCYAAGISTGGSDSAARTAFLRARERLVAAKLCGTWESWAWLLP